MSNTILTVGGRYFDFENPEGFDFDIEDIAHALSHLCRYTGHVGQFYSVAEHSVHVSRLVPDHLAFEALMHDAAEAYLGDVSSPLKRMLPDYKAIEERVERALSRAFGLPYPHDPIIKHADMRMLVTEKELLMPKTDSDLVHWPTDYLLAEPDMQLFEPRKAKEFFLNEYAHLLTKHVGRAF